ncbi:hypothetical protein POX_b02356 [Penicillium oxalicum]|uniref:hypothetical protein n=1 Tax=Penicillium oxalicum TaxID=69781 RepID=UPI0020B63D14|nr:hypothetical protein POX_b02356 [Penicillium oxalicum]KAI2792319.1 hypothetical protein POX_b02356 [Penicillium oxalicum]
MAPSKSSTEGLLGLTAHETRLLVLAHLCLDKESRKIDFDKMASRINSASASARSMYNRAIQKLVKHNSESDGSMENDSTPSMTTTASPPPSTPGPVRNRGRGRGRGTGRGGGRGRRKAQPSERAATAEAEEVEGQLEIKESGLEIKEPELEMKDAYEQLTVAEDKSLET